MKCVQIIENEKYKKSSLSVLLLQYFNLNYRVQKKLSAPTGGPLTPQ